MTVTQHKELPLLVSSLARGFLCRLAAELLCQTPTAVKLRPSSNVASNAMKTQAPWLGAILTAFQSGS